MKPRSKKAIVCLVIVASVVVLVAAGFALKRPILEQWFLWKLESDDELERVAASERLGEMRSVRAIPLLIKILRQVPAEERPRKRGESSNPHFSAVALTNIGVAALPDLIQMLAHESDNVQKQAENVIVDIGLSAIAPLEAKLGISDERIQRGVALTLGEIESETGRSLRVQAMAHIRAKEYGSAIEDLEKALEENSFNFLANYQIAFAHLLLKDYGEAIQHFRTARRARPADQLVLYNLACAYALSGKTEDALDSIEAAMASGFSDVEHIKKDPDLASLRSTERFKRLVDRFKIIVPPAKPRLRSAGRR